MKLQKQKDKILIERLEMFGNPISVFIIGPESWRSFGILNPNAFPEYLRSDVMACGDKLALISYSVKIIQKELDRDLTKFINELNYDDTFKNFVPDPQKPTISIYHNISFQAGVQSVFITTKSMLDIYARIISKSIEPKSTLFGFNKAKFMGNRIAGGRLLNWIEQNSPGSYANKEKLIEILNTHIDNWINDLVRRRDEIIKGRSLGITEMHVQLSKQPKNLRKDEIILPTIDNKVNIIEYGKQIEKYINQMLKDTLVLLPNVNTNLLIFPLTEL